MLSFTDDRVSNGTRALRTGTTLNSVLNLVLAFLSLVFFLLFLLSLIGARQR
jgi:hypothetical protein